jgi:putative SOS response-associated peptidase YedK
MTGCRPHLDYTCQVEPSKRGENCRIPRCNGVAPKSNSGLQCRAANLNNAPACTPIPQRPQRARSGPYLKAETLKRPNRLGVLLWAVAGRAFGRSRAYSNLAVLRYIAAMCGRATYKLTWEEIAALYRLTLDQPAVNTRACVCPTTTIDTMLDQDGKRRLERMWWGLIPLWWSKPLKEMKLATFNARAETVATKPMFRSAFKRNRCLIPVSGYYEWQDTPGGKQPWYFTARDGSPALTIAGLWDEWQGKESDKPLKSCTMIITEPNKFVAEVHDRMPALLAEKNYEPWLSGKAGPELLKPAPEDVRFQKG